MISPFPRSPDPHSDNMHAKARILYVWMRNADAAFGASTNGYSGNA